ncbi:MAG: hypothetical protein CYPHOPRED_005850 [Cyphobasidiales sp. Tagirdzhanova-0007]|nr:MAG: hypothetical protein CYPHOPRED_005850 [Cyphobasidiales sp. Tagirdzhanova-0007]
MLSPPLLLAALCTLVHTASSSSSSSSSHQRTASVYLFNRPSIATPNSITYSAPDANAVISSYLSIEEWERLREGLIVPHQAFFSSPSQHAQDPSRAQPLLILADKQSATADITDYLSTSTLDAFSIFKLDIEKAPNPDGWQALLGKYIERLEAKFGCFGSKQEDAQSGSPSLDDRSLIPGSLNLDYAFGEAAGQDEIYTTYLNSLSSLAAYEATGKVPSTGFIHLTGLSEIEQKFGTESEETEKAKEMLRLTVDSIVTSHQDRKIAFFLIPPFYAEHTPKSNSHKARRSSFSSPYDAFATHPRALLSKRQDRTPAMPLLPTSGYCYPDASTCSNSTSSCFSHGSCVQAIKAGLSPAAQPVDCWTCQCVTTQDQSGRTRYWSGSMCQKEDVSSQFFLLAGATFLLLFIGISAISLLAKIGSERLPSTLAALGGGPGGHNKRD